MAELSYSTETYRELAEYLHSKAGLFYSENKYTELDKGITAAMTECRFATEDEFLRELRFGLLTSPLFDSLMRALTIGETYFFRENKIFEVLKERVIPEMMVNRKKENKPLKIWSAACCTGEEPYTIAMLLKMMFPSADSKMVNIIGTDINSDFLERAKKGIYREWSFRGVDPAVKQRFFTRSGDEYRLDPVIREMVVFRTLNLIDDEYPSFIYGLESVDLIFCRNVLIYFSDEGRHKVFTKMYNTLREEGHLILSLTETAHQSDKRFVTSFVNGLSFFTRREKKEAVKSSAPKPVLPETELPEKMLGSLAGKRRTQVVTTEESITPELSERIMSLIAAGKYKEVVETVLSSKENLPYEKDKRELIFSLLVRAALQTGDKEPVTELIERENKMNRTSPLLYFLLAELTADTGTAEAIELLLRSLFLDSEYPPARLLLASLYHAQGDEEKRKKELRILSGVLEKIKDDVRYEELEGMTAAGMKAAVRRQI